MRVEKKNVVHSVLLTALVVLLLAVPAWAGQAGKSPVKVFILAGQSNMEGQGEIGHLESLVKNPASAPRYKHLVDKDGKWIVRDDVWCVYGNKGKLTVGGFAGKGAIGPELGFGWEVGNYLVNFIKDIRKDLGVPNLPFVIGGSGFGGWEQKVARRLKISAAQRAAAEREEFKGNVFYVETRPFFRPREVSPNGFGYHWNCNAETYYLIGDGMGKAMVELLGGPKVPANATDPTPKKEKKPSGPKAPPPAVVKLEELTLDLGNKVTMKLLKIPAGKFMMGSPEAEEGRRTNEGPQHEVTISKPFYMGVYSADRQTDPTGAATGGKYAVRGGDWSKSPDVCRAARRFQAAGGRAFNRDGFRVVVAVQ